ncbi:hypothetical protein [Burkholderia stagnalis]|uniref:hypothetical protein n=1 Tax=Burkholderia stagnalis TaxID=1503054 RepID=UPI0007562206|nr:hypothetical protein [Burkholderia stagnalis]KVL96225.1 hypothetical protein WT03_10785 [Burkholderia stagnalis]KVL96551.1 hypothetical protein WT02_15950 [Burkholderia stagnalis]KVM13412.1 hypothetical protein WT04_10130 [Burkholderia stagnalis]
MKLFNSFAETGYHTTIVTTFGVDFAAYESIALPRLREAGSTNNVLVADARMLVQAMEGGFRRPRFAGRRYSVVGIQPAGVFHPKLILQLGSVSGRLLVTSANMTAAGLAGNLEVIGEVRTDEADPSAMPILRAALDYVERLLPDVSVARRQLDWALKRTRWLAEAKSGDGAVMSADGGVLAFLASGGGRGIGARFIERIGARRVTRFIAVSPYWDANLSTLDRFRHELMPARTAVLLRPNTRLFPVHRWPSGAHVSLHDLKDVKSAGSSRFAHAKIFIAETETADCVLFGSANCTTAALGAEEGDGVNEEACLYRETAPGRAAELLGLASALDATAIPPATVASYQPADNIPMAEFQRRLPGRFELVGDRLYWWPPAGLDAAHAEIALFDSAGARLTVSLERAGSGAERICYRCRAEAVPHFAQVSTDGFESSLAIVVVEQALKEAQRRFRSRAVESALALLDDEDAIEGLWLLEVIQKLQAAERETEAAAGGPAPGHGTFRDGRERQDEQDESASRTLTYEQFIAGRRKATDGGNDAVVSHLASSYQESVRDFLNALIGRGRAPVESGDEDDAAGQNWSLGDETADGEGALDDDRFGSDYLVSPIKVDAAAQCLRRQRQYVKDTQKSLIEAVEDFIKLLQSEASKRDLDVVDLLRLRALMLVVLGAGSRKSNLMPGDVNAKVSRQQVLPSAGDESWQRRVTRLLYELFRTRNGGQPLIARVVVDTGLGGGLPEDVLECWATCFWALCAMRVFVSEEGAPVQNGHREDRLAATLYRFTCLLPEEALGDAVREIFAGMSRRYGARLGVNEAAVLEEHTRLCTRAQEMA